MNVEARKYEIVLTSPMLGTVPKNKEVYTKYIAEKGKEARRKSGTGSADVDREVDTVMEDLEEKGWTGFHYDADSGELFIYNYMLKGMLKAGLEVAMENGRVKKIAAYKKWCDLLLHVHPRKILLGCNVPDGVLERPLRASTAQGPRVALARSDFVSEGRTLKFGIELLDNNKGLTWDAIDEALSFGRYVGLGQWRGSGGYGQFDVYCR